MYIYIYISHSVWFFEEPYTESNTFLSNAGLNSHLSETGSDNCWTYTDSPVQLLKPEISKERILSPVCLNTLFET